MHDTSGIVFQNVRLRLGKTQFAFDCRLPKGAITAVAGPSGSGKSTLLNLVAGFENPDEGQVVIDGRNVTGLHPSKRPVSLVFQDNNLFAHLDIFTNVGLGISPSLKLSGDDRATISQALGRVGLGGFEKRRPSTLSGGEKQRVAFARALVRHKPVLLLDEPFAALDPGLRGSMAALLCNLHRETENTVLIVTHDPDELREIADHVVFIGDGRIVVSAPVGDFLSLTDIPDIQDFLAG